MLLKLSIYTGLVGAFLLFCGDMILYYNKDTIKSDDWLSPLIDNMVKESRIRLYIGSLIGPLAAFLYSIGFYHIVLITKPEHSLLAWISFLINCLAIIYGGTYHSYFANLGLIFRHGSKACSDETLNFLNIQKNIAFGLQGLGFFTMALLIVMSFTILARWMLIFTPLCLIMLMPLINKLPSKAHIILHGGWTNIISIIYYIALIIAIF